MQTNTNIPPEQTPPMPMQPGAPHYQPPVQSNNNKKTVIIVISAVVGFFILLIAGLIIGGVLLFNGIMGAGSRVPSAFVGYLAEGNYIAAHSLLSDGFMPVEELRAGAGTLNLDPSCEFRISSTNIQNSVTEASGTVRCDSSTYRASFTMVNDKIVEFDIRP